MKTRAERVLGRNSIRRQVEEIKKKKITEKKVVNLADFREARQSEQSHTILVVDDEEIMRNALKRILEGEGYTVLLAADGLELSKVLETAELSLILLDVNLPWVDGYDLCRLIKQHHVLKHVPLVFVSARKSEQDIKRGFDAGCNDYVTKPFDIDFISSKVRQLLLDAS